MSVSRSLCSRKLLTRPSQCSLLSIVVSHHRPVYGTYSNLILCMSLVAVLASGRSVPLRTRFQNSTVFSQGWSLALALPLTRQSMHAPLSARRWCSAGFCAAPTDVASTRLGVPLTLLSGASWWPSRGRPKPLIVSELTKERRGWQYAEKRSCAGPCVRAACAFRMSPWPAIACQLNQSASVLCEGICSRPLATLRGPKSVRSASALCSSTHGARCSQKRRYCWNSSSSTSRLRATSESTRSGHECWNAVKWYT